MLGQVWNDPALAPRDQILAYARKVLAEFAGTDVWDAAKQLRAASAHTANEYAGRFLLELLQNAHDAHPPEEFDGKITIIIDADEGEHGVAYVANAGTPFTLKSMSGLCKLARSPKPVGQGIGHKGVGFRSILQVCSRPEIYSADPAGPQGNLDGYTFRFAHDRDLLTLAGGDVVLAQRAADEFPPFQLPFPSDTIPDAARELANAGHVTVVRLPLDSREARAEALAQAASLAASDVPVLLFLERIAFLTIDCRGETDTTDLALPRDQILTRDRKPLHSVEASQVSVSRVDLGGLGAYTVSSARVDAARLKDSVRDAQQANRMSPEWDDWDVAVVSLAVPVEGEVTGRMFTFLPMGDKALSPFAGHLNAPFFTKLDRTDLDAGHPLNDLLLDVAAETALTAAAALQASGIEAARRWVSDLVCWVGPHRQRLEEAADRSGLGPLVEREFIPIEVTPGHEGGWASLAVTYRWPARNPTVLTAARAAEVGTCLVDSGLGPSRTDRWEEVADWLDCPLSPDAATLAGLVEEVVAGLSRPSPYEDTAGTLRLRRSKKRKGAAAKNRSRAVKAASDTETATLWAGVYNDLAVLFATEDRGALSGRMFLVDDAGDLRPANTPPPTAGSRSRGRRVTAFLPPARDDTPVAIPASLRQHLYYLHPSIAELIGATDRAFLIGANIAYGYDIRSLLEHVGTVVARSESERTLRDALRFVFTLEQNGQIPARHPLTQLRLQIPTSAGAMVPASSAVFGPGWDGPDGSDLVAVIDDAAGSDKTLADLRNRLVDPTADIVRPGDSRAAWSAFLTKLGVGTGLPAQVTGTATPKLMGWQLNGPDLAKRTHVPGPIAEQWAAQLANRAPLVAAHPYTEYVVNRRPVWAVGQTVAEQLTDAARESYARLVLHGLSRWPAEYLAIYWERDRQYGNKDRHTMTTPLAAFLTTSAWLPAAPRSGQPRFARPDQLWHFPISSDDAEPAFGALVSRAVRAFLDANPKVLAALQTAGLGLWSSPTDAARLVRDLGEAAAAGAIGDDQRDQFLRAYLQAWSNVATRTDVNLGKDSDLYLVLREGPRLSVRTLADLAADKTAVHLVRPGDGLHLRLLDELELHTLFVDAELEGARKVLAARLGDRVRIVEESAVSVAPTGVVGPGETLFSQLHWVTLAVAVAADHGRGLTLQDREFEELARRLRRLRVPVYSTLGLSLFDQPTELPAASCGMIAAPDSDDPTVLSPISLTALKGRGLVALAEEVAVAVGYAGVRVRLRAAVLELQQAGNDRPDPSDADLARALRLSTAQVAGTRTRLDGGLEAVIGRLYPFLVHWSGRAAADAALDVARATGELAQLPVALTPLTSMVPLPVEELVKASTSATTLEDLRTLLAIGFADLNATLTGLTPPYAPISHQVAHEQALRQHLALHHRNLCDQLRWARLPDFDAGRLQADWPGLRSFGWVSIPNEWGITVDEASRTDLTVLVADALEAKLGHALPTSGPPLPALDSVAAANKARVVRASPDIARLVRAWASAHRVTLHHTFTSDDPGTDLVALLDGYGVLDFRRLSIEDIPIWLDATGCWPAGMRATTDPSAVGITDEQLAAADSKAAVARRERERQKRLVRIGDDEIDVGVEASDMAPLIDALQASLDAHPSLIAAPNRLSKLDPMPAVQGRDRGGAGGGGQRDPMAGLSNEQRQALGFAGEWLAYQWLARVYAEANEASWVSTYRRRVFAGDPGDDGLGFDFKVELKGAPVMFEVKASREAPGFFTLTDSEIREARRHARDGLWRLLLVPFVSDPKRCRILRLPNPFEPRAEGLYRPEGDGIRYYYRLDL